ncbi:hypothetical protein [Nocardia mangyaensis]|uniref:hypothetical protein n=1 Tax=Nocardia mangyaensis TaxID=2213200 RepID=UPI002675662E|nr:hypothetical protein [Nocardia mangyaensis]MDO3647323.1 hypothetical protein [Nocardia mangyaensis]
MSRLRVVAVLSEYDAAVRESMPDRPGPRSLAQWRREFGGSLHGSVAGPDGRRHEISLAAIEGLSADTHIEVTFVRSRPDGSFGEFPADRVVLKEMDAPPGDLPFE